MIRDHVLRIAAVALVLYGLLGFVLLGFAYVLARQTLAEVEAARAAVVAQRDGLVDVLRSTARALDETAKTFGTFGATLDEARRSARQAAELARETSTTAGGLEQAMYVQFFGVQPLAGLGPGFARAAEQLQQLGGDLDATAEALGRNQAGVGATGSGLAEVRQRIDALASAFATTPLLGGPIEALRLFQVAIYGLLLWLGGQAFVSVLLGVLLFRHAHLRLQARAIPAEREGARSEGAGPSLVA
ncbi:MAG TPA: hypothetical protein VG370_17625 [Chloroflexota bacterium]|nr:hypothetical protein [Chloroflexota bacterium]